MIKSYTVTLDYEVVEETKRLLKQKKLSPTINKLLIKFNEEKWKEIKEKTGDMK